jgi:DNA methylase/ParB-like nuclease domain
MIVRQVAIDKIKSNSKNARTHSAKQIRQIANSIVAFDFTNPLLVSEDFDLIAGHGRYQAAKLLGLEIVPVIVLAGLSPAKRRALAIADNRIAENAGWDRKLLALELPELADVLTSEGLDISILGFEAVEIEDIQTGSEAPRQSPQDRIDPKWSDAITVSKPGDLWLLGNHRLLCDDVAAGALARLMGDDRADLAFIDVRATGESSDFIPLLSVALAAAAAVSSEGAIHFVGMDWRHTAECMAAAKPIYGDPINLVVWVKSSVSEGTFYQSQYELIGMFRAGQPPHLDEELRCRRSDVWRYRGAKSFGSGRMKALRSKPVALIADAIKDCTHRGDVVLDVSFGSGTTIVAAERTGRHARALETEPGLVDLAIRRWQKLTRSEARHAGSGTSFDQVAADRTPSDHTLTPTKKSRKRLCHDRPE